MLYWLKEWFLHCKCISLLMWLDFMKKECLPVLKYSKVLSSHIFEKFLNEMASISGALGRTYVFVHTCRDIILGYIVVCEFKYWVIWDPACPTLPNSIQVLFLNMFIYFHSCRVSIIHLFFWEDSVKVRKLKSLVPEVL